MAKAEYIWAIGDIHGYASSLVALLNHIKNYNSKRIIYLGDYIDRGPEPKEVLDLILEQSQEQITLLGNHEMMLLNAIEGEEISPRAVFEWSENGYETTLKSFHATDVLSFGKSLDKKYVDFFNSLKLFHVESFVVGKKSVKLLFSHAGPFLDFPLNEQLELKDFNDLSAYLKQKQLTPAEACLWNTDKNLQKSMSSWDEHILIHGHMRTQYRRNRNRLQYGAKEKEYNYDLSDIPNPLYFPGGAAVSALDIDTGVDIGGKLTAIGFSRENIDFTRGKMLIKVIQASADRRNKAVNAVEYDLTLPFTDDIGWFGKILKTVFKSKKKKKTPPPPAKHHH
jgi:predicted MPP superfamily phosphohydrolase